MLALRGFAWLLVFQSCGELLARAFGGLPGPVIGLFLMLPALRFQIVREPAGAAAQLLLEHLSLLFVPVGVGVMVHLGLVAHHGFALAIAILVSTLLGMAVGALVLRALWGMTGQNDSAGDPQELP